MFGGCVKGGAGHVAQCAGHCAGSIESCCGWFGEEAKRAQDGFEFASCGSAEQRESDEGLRDDVVDGGDEGCGIWNPGAALGGFKRESRGEKGVTPRCEDLGKMFLWATKNNVINVGEKMYNSLDVRGERGKGFGDALSHGKTKCGCGKAFALEDTVGHGEGLPDAMPHVYVKVGGGHFHIWASAGAREGKMWVTVRRVKDRERFPKAFLTSVDKKT